MIPMIQTTPTQYRIIGRKSTNKGISAIRKIFRRIRATVRTIEIINHLIIFVPLDIFLLEFEVRVQAFLFEFEFRFSFVYIIIDHLQVFL